MKTASITEIRKRFSFYIKLARKGGTVLITVRKTPVAKLMPPPEHPAGISTSKHSRSKTA